MTKPFLLIATLPLVLAACDASQMGSTSSGTPASNLPEGVLEIVAPSQNLSTARVDETSGCYVYLHNGPVESTYLPLRARNGQPICAREPEDGTAAG